MKKFLLAFSVFASSIYSHDPYLNRQELSLGVEKYHLKRVKKGGIQQTGCPWGVHLEYGRFKRYRFYWGLEADYSKGNLSGKIDDEISLKSHFSTGFVEGRWGYTFQQKILGQFSFTPFIGIGYLFEKNNFYDPSPLPIHFKTKYGYGALGFIAWIHPFECIELGAKFKAYLPYNPKCDVSNDPDNEAVRQKVGAKVNYRLDLPVAMSMCLCERQFNVVLDPFFEYRQYASHINFPFDYFKTKLYFYGAILELQYRW